MREVHSDAVEYLICPTMIRRGETNDGSTKAPFASLEQALDSLAAHFNDGHVTAQRQLDLVCANRPDESQRPTKPRFHYYVDAVPMGSEGDGTDASPWADLPTAVTQLRLLSNEGRLRIEPGQSVRLTRREPFTITAHEHRKFFIDAVAKYVLMVAAIMLVVPVLSILTYLIVQAWPALSLNLILQNPKDFMTAGGLWAPLVGTFFLVLVSLALAAPIGVLAGVYLNEYARDNWFTRTVNLAVVNLAGVPSIVHGLFGVGAFVLAAGFGQSMMAAACTLAVMTLPVIITSTREALAAVPMSFREACWNMGASRWQTVRTIVLPNSISGILTGVILQVSRAAGETAPILFTGAAFYMPVADTGWASYFPYDLFDKCMALSMHLFALRTQVNNVPMSLQFGTAVVLIGLVLTVNGLSIIVRTYLRSRKKW